MSMESVLFQSDGSAGYNKRPAAVSLSESTIKRGLYISAKCNALILGKKNYSIKYFCPT